MQMRQSLAEARQPDFDSDGEHSNAYWAKKSSNAIANNRCSFSRCVIFPIFFPMQASAHHPTRRTACASLAICHVLITKP